MQQRKDVRQGAAAAVTRQSRVSHFSQRIKNCKKTSWGEDKKLQNDKKIVGANLPRLFLAFARDAVSSYCAKVSYLFANRKSATARRKMRCLPFATQSGAIEPVASW